MTWLYEAYLNEGLISKIKEKKEEKEFRKQVEYAKTLFQDLITWYNNPFDHLPFGHTGRHGGDRGYYFIILKMMKVPENKIIDYICKKCKSKAQTLDQWFKDYYYGTDNYWEEDIMNMPETTPAKVNAIKQHMNDLVIEFTSDDEESTLIDINKKALIYYCCETIKKDSIFRWLDDREWSTIMYDYNKFVDVPVIEKAIREADKELGYYLFSECPKGEQKKPFPVKL